ncbi:MAG: 16S rRNA (guanine(527)-N(7))-methyltransferase RsmG [Chloroflexota bacterium]
MEDTTCEAALQLLRVGAHRLGISLSEQQCRLFVRYCLAIIETNAHTNITAMRTPEQIMRGLFLESLTMIPAFPSEWMQSKSVIHLIDVGTGAGVPGVPLKIVFPQWRVTLVESVGKKAGFVQRVGGELGLQDVDVLTARAEEAGRRGDLRDAANLTVARAVAALPTLLELCAPLTRTGGLMIFPKSGDVQREIESATAAERVLGCPLERIVPVPENPDLGSGRFHLVYRKTDATPAGYPRRVGLAKSRPIVGG